jgi:hypothetical protein
LAIVVGGSGEDSAAIFRSSELLDSAEGGFLKSSLCYICSQNLCQFWLLWRKREIKSSFIWKYNKLLKK